MRRWGSSTFEVGEKSPGGPRTTTHRVPKQLRDPGGPEPRVAVAGRHGAHALSAQCMYTPLATGSHNAQLGGDGTAACVQGRRGLNDEAHRRRGSRTGHEPRSMGWRDVDSDSEGGASATKRMEEGRCPESLSSLRSCGEDGIPVNRAQVPEPACELRSRADSPPW